MVTTGVESHTARSRKPPKTTANNAHESVTSSCPFGHTDRQRPMSDFLGANSRWQTLFTDIEVQEVDIPVKLHTTTTGSGTKSVALFHGISGESAMFAEFAEHLAATYDLSVIGVDLRGHGLSPRADDYSLAAFADDVVETLPSRLHGVVGHSLGGQVLLQAVSRLLPERAIYLDPAFEVPKSPVLAGRANVSEHDDGSPFSPDELATVNPGWGPENVQKALVSHSHWDSSMFEQVMTAMPEAKPVTEPPVVPSLVLLGGDSPLVSPELAQRLRDLGYEVRVQEHAGHNLHLDDVDATVACLDGWL
jgi:pimeloyl-ACP methyl ester carboxylesterase